MYDLVMYKHHSRPVKEPRVVSTHMLVDRGNVFCYDVCCHGNYVYDFIADTCQDTSPSEVCQEDTRCAHAYRHHVRTAVNAVLRIACMNNWSDIVVLYDHCHGMYTSDHVTRGHWWSRDHCHGMYTSDHVTHGHWWSRDHCHGTHM